MDYIKGFRQELLQQGKSRNTINNYLQAVLSYKSYVQNRYDKPFAAELVNYESVAYFKEYLLYITLSPPAVINIKLSALTSFADYLVANGVLNYNPVTKMERLKITSVAPKHGSDSADDIQILRKIVYQHNVPRDRAIFELLCNTGIKVNELCALEMDDLDLTPSSPQLIIQHEKEKKRTLPLNALMLSVIESYLQVRPQIDSPRLFQGQRGSLGREAVYRIIDKYAREAGVKISPQDLRDQFCRELIRQGENLDRVAQIAGYSSSNPLKRKIRNHSYTT